MYRELARYLERECDTFVTYPGFNSLYFWTGKRPPTHLNSTGWGQLSHPQQERILASLRQAQRPLLVVVAAAAESWKNGAPEPILPLVQNTKTSARSNASAASSSTRREARRIRRGKKWSEGVRQLRGDQS